MTSTESSSSLARNRGFRRLWSGDVISMFGDWFTYVAVGTLVVEGSQGLLAVAVVLLGHTLPRGLLGPFAGRIADRHDRRTIMVVVSLLRALSVGAMMWATWMQALEAVQVLVFVRIGLSAFIDPAATAMLPQLVPAQQIGRANTVMSATWSVTFGVGVVAGGFVTAAGGPLVAMAIDAATFVISALVFASLPRAKPEPSSDPDSYRSEAQRRAGGFRLAWTDPAILQAALGKLPAGLASGGAWVLVHRVAGDGVLGATAMGLGMLHAARAIGTGIGPLMWVGSLRASVAGLRVSVVVTLLAVAVLTLVESPTWVLIAACMWGLGSGANWVVASTRMQLLTPNEQLGRVAALDVVVFSLGHSCAGLLGAWAADAWGWPELAAWIGVGTGLLGWVCVGLLVRASARARDVSR